MKLVFIHGSGANGNVWLLQKKRFPDADAPDLPECPTCQSTHVTRQGFKVSRTRKYRQYKCQDCGSWFQGALIKD